MNKEKLIKVLDEIAFNVENDAKEFDGKPFDGKNVAKYFRYNGAAIKNLAEILKILIDHK